MKSIVRLTVASAALCALVGCSQLEKIGIHMPSTRAEYESSTSRAPLDVPPDLDSVARTDRFTIPSRPQIVSANAENAKQRMEAEKRGEGSYEVIPQTIYAKVVRDGQTRYVHVNVEPDKVWPVLQDFWPSVGLEVKSQDARTGVMQTEWAENKANLPKDIIRQTVGKIFDFVYDTGERDQYRSRMERNEDGSTNVYITHRQMVEVLKGKEADTTIWQPGPSDPQLEAEMLTRLAQKLESEFNPDAKPQEQKTVEELSAIKYVPVSELINDEKGVAREVLISEPFDRAWRRVGLALDRAGFDVSDRDRSQGLFLIKYLDSDYEAAKKSEQGFFKKLFSSTKPVDAVEYQIRLVGEGDKSHLTVLGSDGRADTTGVAPKILVLISEQAR